MAAQSIALPENVDLVAVGPIHQALLDMRGRDLELDAGAVRQVSGLGVQLLLSAGATWARDGRELKTKNLTPALADAFRLAAIQQADAMS
jgi:anti-anti-sigma regulatory factor